MLQQASPRRPGRCRPVVPCPFRSSTAGEPPMKPTTALGLFRGWGLTAGVCRAQAGPQEATYQGKPVSYWAGLLKDKDLKTRTEAAGVLRQLGTQAKAAVPALKAALRERAFELWLAGKGGPLG